MTTNLFAIKRLKSFAENTFLVFRNITNERTYKYKELIQNIEIILNYFVEKKILPQKCFAFCLKEVTVGALSLLLSVLNYNGYFYPISEEDNLNKEAVNYFVTNDCNAIEKHALKNVNELMVFDEKFYICFVNENAGLTTLPRNMCYAYQTSGSTGAPKTVYVPFDCIASNIKDLCEIFQITSQDVIFLGTPFTFDPFIVEFFMALATGSVLLLTTGKMRLDSQNLRKILWPENDTFAVSVLQMTPTNFRLFGADTIKETILSQKSKLRILILGGEDFPSNSELRKWLQTDYKFNVKIFNIYGITELSCWSSIASFNEENRMQITKRMPLGRPLADTVFRIINPDDGSEVYFGQGELLVGSSTRKTFIPQVDEVEHFQNNKFDEALFRHTGDLVERTESGDVFFISRLDDVIKRMGKKISLPLIEKKLETSLEEFANVKPVCVWDVVLKKLFCCLKTSSIQKHDKQFQTKIRQHIVDKLNDFEKPDRIIFVDEFPINKNKKLDRRKLLENITKTKLQRSPVEIFELFLNENFNIDEFTIETLSKRLRMERQTEIDMISKSFNAVGGTSFQALSLATEIGEFIHPCDQRFLVKMLVDGQTSIAEILNFLKNVRQISDSTLNLNEKKNMDVSGLASNLNLKYMWQQNMKKCIDAAPSISPDGHYISVGSHAHLLLTFSLTGKEISRLVLRNRIECQVTFVSTELALVGCDAGYLYAFNFKSGELKWSLRLGDQIKAKPLVIDETIVIVGCYNESNLACVCLKTQSIKWRKKIGERPIYAAPILLSKTTAIICTLDGSYQRLDVNTGTAMWTQKLDSPIFSTPSKLNEDNFILAEVIGKVHICRNHDGNILKTFVTSGNIFSNISIKTLDSLTCYIVFGCHDHHVYCLKCKQSSLETLNDKEIELTLKWKIELNASIFATPVVAEMKLRTYVIVCSTKGFLSVVELETGSKVAFHDLAKEVFSTPCLSFDNEDCVQIYFGCRDNNFYCFKFE